MFVSARKLLNLSGSERMFLLTTAMILGFVRGGLLLFRLKTTQATLSVLRRRLAFRQYGFSPERVIWAVETASRIIPSSTCLAKALTAQFLLALRGSHSFVCIGVSKNRDDLAAHAWLDCDGRILMGGANSPQLYTHLVSLNPEL